MSKLCTSVKFTTGLFFCKVVKNRLDESGFVFTVQLLIFPMKQPSNHIRQTARAGFALAITLALMVLLTLLAVGLLSLSAVSLRAAGQAGPQAEARANARLALALAMAQLQERTGLDTRITAPADIVNSDNTGSFANPDWRGVWRSNPTTPKAYQPARSDFFVDWLVTAEGKARALGEARSSVEGESTVIRNMEGLPDVRIPLMATPNKGLLGWWTDDESLKARADFPVTESRTSGELLAVRHATPRLGPEVVKGVTGFKPTAANAPGLITPGQLTLAAKTWPDRQGNAFTTYSRSLQTDVRKGGFKADLSALFEQKAANITDFGNWRTDPASASAAKSYLYGGPVQVGTFQVGNGARWHQLYDYYNLYKDVSFSGAEPRIAPGPPFINWVEADQRLNFGDEAGGFRFPRFVKVLYVLSYSSVAAPNPSNPLETYTLRLNTDIYVTMWNPFDVRIVFPSSAWIRAKLYGGVPLKFDWQVNGVSRGGTDGGSVMGGMNWARFYREGAGSTFTMAPGETVVFSIHDGNDNSRFTPGISFKSAVFAENLLPGGKLYGKADDKVSVGLKAIDPGGVSTQGQNASYYSDIWIVGDEGYEQRGENIATADAAFVTRMPEVKASSVPSWRFSEVLGADNKQPFAAFIMETKTARESLYPVPAFLTTGNTRLASRVVGDFGQFVHEHLEYKLEPVLNRDTDLLNTTFPSDPAGPDHGFIGAGRSKATDGQTSFLADSIPTVPLTSLAQFRHAGTGDGADSIRATQWGEVATPYPPYADQAIGNSYAHPLVPPDQTALGTGSSRLLDHRYLGNEVLWDSYFLSSLAARTAAKFGKAKAIADTWAAFLDGTGKLINPRFSPWLGSETKDAIRKRIFGSGGSGEIAKDAYLHIAANLMLDGGFNVNSTSIDAWNAFLASTRKVSLTKLPFNGGTSGTNVTSSGTLYSRTDIVLSDSVDENPGNIATHYSGFRDLSDEKLRLLAEQIVIQVRKRGPFLNLSEFVNRRLTNDTELALCGALQAAIDKSGLNDAVRSAGVATSGKPGGASMAFPKACELGTAAGNPGWLLQGDMLDPLGSALVARGDTFRIRGYGDARDAQGKVTARAWCEAVVQRVPEYLDNTEKAEIAEPKQSLNKTFGRRYQLFSFRWLSGPDA